MVIRNTARPPDELEIDELIAQLQSDLAAYLLIKNTRYLNPQPFVEKSGNLHLAWIYAQNPADHGRFQHMLRHQQKRAADIVHYLAM